VEDGIGDVMIFLLNFCHSNGLDAEAILTKTWAEVGKRDWVQFPGNGVDK
jgi:NTP pyrophosphatase (non-canonical NTP hydrolase)